jgi:hypothetical protein
MRTIKNSIFSALLVSTFVATNLAARPIKVPVPPVDSSSIINQLWALLTAILPGI